MDIGHNPAAVAHIAVAADAAADIVADVVGTDFDCYKD